MTGPRSGGFAILWVSDERPAQSLALGAATARPPEISGGPRRALEADAAAGRLLLHDALRVDEAA